MQIILVTIGVVIGLFFLCSMVGLVLFAAASLRDKLRRKDSLPPPEPPIHPSRVSIDKLRVHGFMVFKDGPPTKLPKTGVSMRLVVVCKQMSGPDVVTIDPFEYEYVEHLDKLKDGKYWTIELYKVKRYLFHQCLDDPTKNIPEAGA